MEDALLSYQRYQNYSIPTIIKLLQIKKINKNDFCANVFNIELKFELPDFSLEDLI